MKKFTTIMIIVLAGLIFTATAYSHDTEYGEGYRVFLKKGNAAGTFTKCKNIHLSPYGVFASYDPLNFDNEGSANRWPKKGQKFQFFPYTAVDVILPTID